MHIVVVGLAEERGGAVSRGEGGRRLPRGAEVHVVDGLVGRDVTREVPVGHAPRLGLRTLDLLTEQEREVVLVLEAEAVGGGVGPDELLALRAADGRHRELVVGLAGACHGSVETVVIAERKGYRTFRAEHEAFERLPFEPDLVGDGVAVLLAGVLADVVLRVGVLKHLLVIRVNCRGIPERELVQAVGRTVAEHVDDAAGADVVAAGTCVAAVGELRVEVEGEPVGERGAELHVEVGAAHA